LIISWYTPNIFQLHLYNKAPCATIQHMDQINNQAAQHIASPKLHSR
jgi:hypothetical protein